MASILIVEDEALLARQVARALTGAKHLVRISDTVKHALELINDGTPDLILTDLRLPDGSGRSLMAEALKSDDSIQVIIMTAYGSVTDAVDAMREGAADYIQKPLDLDELQLLVERTLKRRSREQELAYHRGQASGQEIIGNDPTLREIFQQVERLSVANLSPSQRPTILICGETGTGKGMLARAIHENLGGGAFIAANCTAIPDTLIESELFGHEKGSFTDAKTAKSGLFEAAEGGTIFLDEIGHAGDEMQAKLLKVLEEKKIRRLGSTRDREVDVHIIAATNRDLDEAVEKGEFRRDLLHRLRVLSFEAPPLRSHPQDILPLAQHFLKEVGHRYRREISLSTEAISELEKFDWPGNVRELRNVIERSVLIEDGSEITGSTVSRLIDPRGQAKLNPSNVVLPNGGLDLAVLERDLILQALEAVGGNQTQAAKLLRLTRDTLRYRMEKFEISV
jgi:two-component system, NtrC family, response regulator AtoC